MSQTPESEREVDLGARAEAAGEHDRERRRRADRGRAVPERRLVLGHELAALGVDARHRGRLVAAAGDLQEVGARLLEHARQQDELAVGAAAGVELHRDRRRPRQRRAQPGDDLEQEPRPAGQVAAVGVLAAVVGRVEERAEEIPVRRVHLDAGEARGDDALAGADEALGDVLRPRRA